MDLQICIFRPTTLWEKRETFCDEKKAQQSHFPKRVNPCFWSKKCQFFLYLISVKTRLVVALLNDFLEKKETFLSVRKNNFSKSKKSPFFSKGLTPCSWPKNATSSPGRFSLALGPPRPQSQGKAPWGRGCKKCQFFLYLNFIKLSLEIMLSDFAEKKETFFDLKKQHFFKVHKIAFFLKGLTHTFCQKMPILFLI